MKRFTAKIVDLMKQEKLYSSQGGPIILSQIENEYGNVDSLYGPAAKTYIRWAASVANSLDTGVPWVMCQQVDAPDPMYHGGTNFERTTGGPFIATTYDFDAPIDEYGILLVSVYKTGSGLCSAFLANVGTESDATMNFGGSFYNLLAWSVSILPDCKSVALNTAKINSMATIPRFISQSVKDDVSSSEAFKSDWRWVSEPVGISNNNAFAKPGLLEQISITADNSDNMWYSLRHKKLIYCSVSF
ncbi:hypothetical protein LguiB_017898 [Lonicera macranthoides]